MIHDMPMFCKIRFLLFIALLTLSTACKERKTEVAKPLTIEVCRSRSEMVPNTRQYIASISANYSATIQPRIAGFLATSSFSNGMPVKRGQTLFTLDDAPQRAARLAAEAVLSSAKAKAIEARRNYERAIPLASIDAISQTQLDQYTAEHSAAIAAVNSAEQSLRNAILEESYTRIKSPISGIISSSAATVGDYVGPATPFSTLTTVQSIDTVAVDLAIPMADYLALSGRKELSYSNADLLSDIRLHLADGTLYPESGFYKFTRQSISNAMGTIVVVVGFRNPDYALKAGQFARITASLGSAKSTIVVPQKAVSQVQNISSVWIIGADSTAEYRKVKVGDTFGEWWIIEEGINEGEIVATSGLQKLRNGMKVSTNLK